MLETINLHKSFGENHVLNGINLSLHKNKIYTIIGGNGTGKTTLFNLITGFIKPDKGSIIFKGKEISTKHPVTINHYGITRTFQDLRLITNLSVKENILLSFKKNPGEKIFNSILPPKIFKFQYNEYSVMADEVLSEVHLQGVADNLAGEISYGQQKLLTLGCCIANDAQLMLLDEPVAGIDRENYSYIIELIMKLKDSGKTIIQIEHSIEYVKNLSDKIWFFNEGCATEYDNYETFIRNKKVQEVYLI